MQQESGSSRKHWSKQKPRQDSQSLYRYLDGYFGGPHDDVKPLVCFYFRLQKGFGG